ncbi:hypothetical protein [Streptomyces recifensis]|jgi:hypothetical protein|uniref:hypothetical protein n=1 Tax=Streptomyces recifensis TaxID=67355 RepID=UPI000A3C072C|nr:hypothetical protein [Streptomyces recifensis]
MKVRRTGAAIAVLPCLVLLGISALAACGPDEGAELGSDQLTCVWQGTGGGTVRFGADGRFEMSGIPRSAVVFSFSDPPPGDGRMSGGGEWELAGGDGTPHSLVRPELLSADGTAPRVNTSGRDASPQSTGQVCTGALRCM